MSRTSDSDRSASLLMTKSSAATSAGRAGKRKHRPVSRRSRTLASPLHTNVNCNPVGSALRDFDSGSSQATRQTKTKGTVPRTSNNIAPLGMDKYKSLEVVGEGSYGVVMKCRHRETGQVVAIKKFLETEEDQQVRKMAFREIRMLKKLRHENLVSMIEVFRRRKRFYLVFEYLDHTLLDELERAGDAGLGFEVARRHIFQVLRGLNFCHNNHIMHRDVKPENVLVSPNGVIKLCDFGFARFVSGPNESCTDYVATRWYRAPELLVGDPRYGRAVDVWAAGCLYAEMITSDPLFPGDSDVDQLYRITKVLGALCPKHRSIMNKPGETRMLRHASVDDLAGPQKLGLQSLRTYFPNWAPVPVDFLAQCLRMDPDHRPKCSTLLQHQLFLQDGFTENFMQELQRWVAKESMQNTLGARKDERQVRVHSGEHESRVCRSTTGRWQMTLTRSTGPREKAEVEPIEIEETRQTQKQTSPSQISRPRELCYFGPVSVVPNTTYIRRLEHRALLEQSKSPCGLPTLTPKDRTPKFPGKRKRIDFLGVDR